VAVHFDERVGWYALEWPDPAGGRDNLRDRYATTCAIAI